MGVSGFFLLLHILGVVLPSKYGERAYLWQGVAYAVTATTATVYLAITAYVRLSDDLLVATIFFTAATVYLWKQVGHERRSRTPSR